VNFAFLNPINKDKPVALTSYEHLGVQLWDKEVTSACWLFFRNSVMGDIIS